MDTLRALAEPDFLEAIDHLKNLYGGRFSDGDIEIVAAVRVRRIRRERAAEVQGSNKDAITAGG